MNIGICTFTQRKHRTLGHLHMANIEQLGIANGDHRHLHLGKKIAGHLETVNTNVRYLHMANL